MPDYALPAENTDAGAMARLFIAEAAVPRADSADTVKAMGWMRRVLENRLRHGRDFDARGATTITHIITAHDRHVQFAGFTAYPALSAKVQQNVTARLALANNARDRRQPIYGAFVQAAITAATSPAPADPCPTGLWFWRTADADGPGGRSSFFQTLDGNDFYTLPAGFFSPPPARGARRH